MAAWILSGGSILSRTWMPYWVANDAADRELLERAATAVGVDLDYTRSAAAGGNRARELRPIEDASVLGRVLTVLGAPRGEKDESGGFSLPSYLDAAPVRVGQEFVQVYLRNRGKPREGGEETVVRKVRPDGYLRELASLIRGQTGKAVSVSATEVILSAAAAEAIQAWPPVLQVADS